METIVQVVSSPFQIHFAKKNRMWRLTGEGPNYCILAFSDQSNCSGGYITFVCHFSKPACRYLRAMTCAILTDVISSQQEAQERVTPLKLVLKIVTCTAQLCVDISHCC